MITILSGHVVDKNTDQVTILTSGGVGYSVRLSCLQLSGYEINQEVQIPTYLKVSDNSLELFGFESNAHRDFFSLLLSVKSVGPKSAMHILSLGSIEEIKSAIARGDVEYLTAVQGMGKKTAERIVVELKNKVTSLSEIADNQGNGAVLAEVIEGLVTMGYSKEAVKSVVQDLDSKDKDTEDLLREALKILGKM